MSYNVISFGILAGTRYIHLRMSNMTKMSHGCCKKKIPTYMYLIYETYDHLVNIRALHSMHKSQLQ